MLLFRSAQTVYLMQYYGLYKAGRSVGAFRTAHALLASKDLNTITSRSNLKFAAAQAKEAAIQDVIKPLPPVVANQTFNVSSLLPLGADCVLKAWLPNIRSTVTARLSTSVQTAAQWQLHPLSLSCKVNIWP